MNATILFLLVVWLTVGSLVEAFLGYPSSVDMRSNPLKIGPAASHYFQDPIGVCLCCFSTFMVSPLIKSFATRRTQRKPTVRSSTVATAACEQDIDFVSEDGTIHSDADIDCSKLRSNTEKAFGLYIHIPYCRQRCRYCDFAIVPIGDHGASKSENNDTIDSRADILSTVDDFTDSNGSTSGQQQFSQREQKFRQMNDQYISAIVAELNQLAAAEAINPNGHRDKIPLRSIYFGGGTPSLAPIESIEKILYHVCGNDNPKAPFRLLQQQQPSHFDKNVRNSFHTDTDSFAPNTEITMEMDPGTFDRGYLSSLRDMGVNRVSLGVQSFDDDLLRVMGRTHRRTDILQAVRDIAFVFGDVKDDGEQGYIGDSDCWKNVSYSIDLISGCPGLTPAKWTETLHEATAGLDRKRSGSTSTAVHSSFPKIIKRQSWLLTSLPPPKHISVYDMQIEEGTVFGKWAAAAKEEAEAERKETLVPMPYDDAKPDDEEPLRQFRVSLPPEDSYNSHGRRSRKTNPEGKSKLQGRFLRLPSEEDCAFMYKYAVGYLRAKNYEHYEVSSYAALKSGAVEGNKNEEKNGNCASGIMDPMPIRSISQRSIHNQIYWEYDGQWFAFGLGATSFVDKKLVARPREMSDYIEWVQKSKNCTSSEHLKYFCEEDVDILSDLILKRLRTIDGLDLSWLEANHGSDTVEGVLEGAKLGLELGLAEHTDSNILRLNDPDG